MTEHSTHAPHHSHVRKAIEVVHEKHAQLQASHHQAAADVAEARAKQLQDRIAAVSE